MGVPEEDRPYMEQYHGYMFGSDTTHRGPVGAPIELHGGNPCPKCRGRGNVRIDAAEKRNHELAAQYVARFGDHAVMPKHLYNDEDYANIHASGKELRLAAEAAAPVAAAAAFIPP
eukprot:jgi/Tetstr1/430433/TSEL_020243.t1